MVELSRAGQALGGIVRDAAVPLSAPAIGASRRDTQRLAPERLGGGEGQSFAALDLGTNNCRLLIAAPAYGGGLRIIDSFSRVTRLGEGLHETGRLGEAAMDRTLGALEACAARIGRRNLAGLRAVATEACRRASNGRDFIALARRHTGIPLDVISSREEAELALESCAALLLRRMPGVAEAERGLVFDIGGGSTEIAWVRMPSAGRSLTERLSSRPQLIGYDSLPVGVITLAEMFGEAAFTPDGYDAMVAHVMLRLQAFERTHCIAREMRRSLVRLLGTSGTVTTLASIVLDLPRYQRTRVDGLVMTSAHARTAASILRSLGRTGLETHRCIGPARAPYVLPGCAIFEAIHRVWPVPEVVVADRGLRDGMLLRMMRDAGPVRGGVRREAARRAARVPVGEAALPA